MFDGDYPLKSQMTTRTSLERQLQELATDSLRETENSVDAAVPILSKKIIDVDSPALERMLTRDYRQRALEDALRRALKRGAARAAPPPIKERLSPAGPSPADSVTELPEPPPPPVRQGRRRNYEGAGDGALEAAEWAATRTLLDMMVPGFGPLRTLTAGQLDTAARHADEQSLQLRRKAAFYRLIARRMPGEETRVGDHYSEGDLVILRNSAEAMISV